ncbi:MAG: hypothetical protein FWH27_17905, partial [Planctomycetaceae bacterium]|nr:hypothetical protein [Planctomycetaceae bacterium]
IILPVTFFVLAGCQRLPERPDGMPELTRCTVHVTFGGERLQGVSVLLQPAAPQTLNWPAGGQTDTEGKAVMKTAAYYNGVVPGEYFVIFQKHAEPELRGDGMPLPAKPLIPIRYSKADTTERIVVTKEQTDYVFELEGLTPAGHR